MGAVIGGISGGLDSMARGGSFLDGFEDGAFSGAISGAITGAAFAGLGQLGAVLGKGIKCASTLGKFVKGTAAVTKVMSMAMGGFDTIALLDKAFGTGDIAALNAKLHENKAYNLFQIGVSATAVFTGGMTTTMKCFVAGTLVLTANGLIAIEAIKVGDMVYAADADTLEVSLQPVLETYIRETSNLVHITVNEENIISTFDHPYFVKGEGFVSAENLWIGAELVDNNGNALCIEQIYHEKLDNESEKVYNFKVDECHTYFVSKYCILVHNADYSENLIPNKADGLRREESAQKQISEQYPKSEGYRVEGEKLLRDSSGKKVIDPETGTGRRIDFVVDKNGKIVDSIEVTSSTADKTAQMAKEMRIRQNGGNYVRLSDKSLVEIPSNIQTRILRLP